MKKISTHYWPDSPLYYRQNPDRDNSSKIMNYNHAISNREKAIVFGELQVYGELLVNGELEVLQGESYVGTFPAIISGSYSIYGPVDVTELTTINGEVNIL
jgi:hypothetical protein